MATTLQALIRALIRIICNLNLIVASLHFSMASCTCSCMYNMYMKVCVCMCVCVCVCVCVCAYIMYVHSTMLVLCVCLVASCHGHTHTHTHSTGVTNSIPHTPPPPISPRPHNHLQSHPSNRFPKPVSHPGSNEPWHSMSWIPLVSSLSLLFVRETGSD